MPSPEPRPILLVGPEPGLSGGMAAVLRQMAGLSYAGRYRPELFPTTAAEPGESLPNKLARHLRRLSSLRQAAKRIQPAVAHVHTCSGFSLFRSSLDCTVLRSCGVPVVLHLHGGRFESFHRSAGWFRKTRIRRALEKADAVIALSDGWRSVLREIAPAARVSVVENAVDTTTEPVDPSASSRCRFLFLGHMDETKGVDDLLSACFELRARQVDFELALAGPAGSSGDACLLQSKMNRLDLSDCARYLGDLSADRRDAALDACDVFVLPSHFEGLPLSVLEAMARRRAVIATRVGAIPEVISHGREGLLIHPHRPGEIAAAMAALAGDPDLRGRMAAAGRALAVQRFSLERLEGDLLRLYDRLAPAADQRGSLNRGRAPREVVASGPAY